MKKLVVLTIHPSGDVELLARGFAPEEGLAASLPFRQALGGTGQLVMASDYRHGKRALHRSARAYERQVDEWEQARQLAPAPAGRAYARPEWQHAEPSRAGFYTLAQALLAQLTPEETDAS